MADITIKSSSGATEFADGATVKLEAVVPDKATKIQWLLNEAAISGATTKDHSFTMGVATDGEYRVTAEDENNKPIESNRLDLARKGEEADKPSIFYPVFAAVVGIAALVVGFVVWTGMSGLFSNIFSSATWTSLDGKFKIAIALAIPASIAGAVLLLAGAWMAIVEWRGRLKNPPKRSPGKSADEGISTTSLEAVLGAVNTLVGTVSGLKGATLPIVVGALLMFGTLWVAQSAASNGGPSPTSAPTAVPSGEPTPTPAPPATPTS